MCFNRCHVECVCVCVVCAMYRARFHPNGSDRDAARAIIEVVENACLSIRYVSMSLFSQSVSFVTGKNNMLA